MKPKILMVLLAVLMLCLGSTTFAFANDTNNAQETNSEFSIPVFDSIQEAEVALNEENNIQPLAIGDEGGTQICTIYPYIVRQNSLTEKCQLYLKYESDLRVQSIRFKELIVESEYIGINYLKLKPDSGKSYRTYDMGSLYKGYKTIKQSFNIPLSEDRVTVRSKGMGVYFNDKGYWLSCQYQIRGWWEVTPKNVG